MDMPTSPVVFFNPLARLLRLAPAPEAEGAPAAPLAPAQDAALLPYKQELQRGFSAFMSFAFTLTAVGVLPSICTNWGTAMATGGPSVILYGWLICAFFTTLTGIAMAEVNAKYPNAGSVYYWAAMLAPRRHAAVAAYACGLLNLAGNCGGNAAFALGFANFVRGALALQGWERGVGAPPDAQPLSRGAVVGLAMTVSASWAAINALRIDQQGWLNNTAAVWQVGATVVIVAVVLGAPPRDADVPSDWVWRTPYSATGFEGGSQYSGYVYLLGLLNALFAFSGYEAGTHMAEETRNASIASSWGIVYCCLLTFVIGLVFNLGMLYATPAVLQTSYAQWAGAGGLAGLGVSDDPYVDPTDTSLPAYLRHAMRATAGGGSILVFFSAAGGAGGAALSALLIVQVFFTGVSSLTATSRMCYAMARDQALPWSDALTYIWPATATPLGTVLATLAMVCALLMLGLATSQGLTAVLSITVVGFQLSYAMPLVLRVAGSLSSRSSSSSSSSGSSGSDMPVFVAHPGFDLGAASVPIHAAGAAWLLFTSLVLLWPTAWPVTGENVNLTVAVVAGLGVVGWVWWVLRARHCFAGPREAAEAAALEAAAAEHRAGCNLERLTVAEAAVHALQRSGGAASVEAEGGGQGSEAWAGSASGGGEGLEGATATPPRSPAL